tara:strand:+ start:340 stop:4155 length:3816 start_codon:yes stop_codon:yes gene_type:complete
MINDVTGGTYVIEYPSGYLVDVNKYHASQFYNWEQDNIPIDDLETRTNTLGAALGLFRTDITGVSMIVDGTDVSSSSRYPDVSTALSLLPKTITFPVLIEVCTYGDLSALVLENFDIKGRGSLEIINRNYSADIPGDLIKHAGGTASKINATATINGSYPWGNEVIPSSIYSNSLWYDLSSAKDTRNDISCYSAASWNTNAKFISFPHLNSSKTMSEPLFHVSSISTAAWTFIDGTTPTDFTLSGENYKDLTVSADANPYEYATSGQTSLRGTNYHTVPAPADTGLVTYAYGNHFSKVKIENCRGSQIQIKGFCVDGGSLNSDGKLAHLNPVGFDIQNSDVVLTSCASFRNSDVGFRVANSNVLVEGGMVGHRNYPFDGSSRTGIDGVDEYDIWNLDYKGHGFEAYRSHITFDPDSQIANDLTVAASGNLGKHGFVMCNNGGDGWHFDSCKISGGVGGHISGAEQGAGPVDYQTTQITAAFNKGNGILLDDSQSTYRGILRSQGNEDNGVAMIKSKVGVMGVISELNNNIGLKIESSEFMYNLGAQDFVTAYDSNDSSWETRAGHSFLTPAVCVENNGISNLKIMNNSKFSNYPIAAQSRRSGLVGGRKEASTATWGMQAPNGNVQNKLSVSDYEKGNIPLVQVTDNSYARFLGLAAFGDVKPVGTARFGLKAPVKGRVMSVTNNSKVDMYGTSAFSTVITNQADYADQSEFESSWSKAGVYAGDSSKIRISGPTKISQFGVATLAENNSIIEIGPAYDANGSYDKNLDPLDTGGHTKLDIQATRACMVASNNSTLDMTKVGASAVEGTASINTATLNLADNGYHTSSYIQFHPHGFTEVAYDDDGGKFCNLDFKATLSTPGALKRTAMGFNSYASPDRTAHGSTTTGGMCVRAIGGSNVKVDQANFEVWVDCHTVSGAYYNIEGSGNEGISVYHGSAGGTTMTSSNMFGDDGDHYGGGQLMMWNIADTSRIVASNMQINHFDGSATDFHGPAGAWGSPLGWDHNSGALDYYGGGGAYTHSYGLDSSALANHGPFRLLTGVNSDLMSYYEGTSDVRTNSLDFGSAGDGAMTLGGSPIAQINAQGYAAPGIAARALDGSDIRKHNKIEGMYAPSANSGAPLVLEFTSQPIFGARWDEAYVGDNGQLTTSATLGRKYLANPMMTRYDSYVPDSRTDVSGQLLVSGITTFPNFPIPPLHMDWQGYLRNFLDESASNAFANSRHGASKMVKLCSIFRSHTNPLMGGEGRDGSVAGNYTFGLGVRSLNMFDLDKLI